ncbi:putative LPS assembly protein LptD [Dokdonia sinensis]|nr:putative LPS assembly protein LptD [Dokdonia sinensis]
MLCSFLGYSQDLPPKDNARKVPARDTTLITTAAEGFEIKEIIQDTVKSDTVRVNKKETLTDKVRYKATDYERISQRLKQIILYNEAEVIYGDMKINAGEIILNYEKNTVFAKGIKDSAGVYTQIPVFIQGGNEVVPDSIAFNFDTQQALIYGSRVEDQATGFNIKNEVSKRVNDSVVFMRNVKFTTSEDIDNPEYYFYARKVKFVPGEKLVTGLTNMYIADVPTPIGLPFAFFPMDKQQSVSGFVLPSPGETRQRGYFLQNGGYYFALSDYYNLLVVGDYYTNGSYGLRASSEYKLRYKFSGRLNFSYERILNSERGLPDFTETNTYNIRWNHSQDTKSSPNSRFSASVNLGSSDFYQQSINQSNTGNFLNNNFSSSVSYSKTFTGKVPVNLTLAATHSQNSRTQEINMTLPTAQVNVDRIFPLAPKSGSKKGAIQNINFSYSARGENRFNTTDSLFFTPEMFRDGQMGVQHSVPISTNFKIAKYISTSVGGSYTENWLFKTIDQSFDEEEQVVLRDTIRGFDSYRTYNGGISFGTTVYGQFNMRKLGGRLQEIRHVMRPSLSYSYTPAFDQFYDSYTRTDPTTNVTEEVEFSRFQGGLYGAPGNRVASSLSFSLSNIIEAKVISKDTTATEPKKISLLKNLNLGTSYNFAADSLKLSPIRVNGTLPIIEGKLNINFSAGLDVYALNNANQRINTLNIDNGGSLFRLTGASANFGYSFSNKDFDGSKDVEPDRRDNSQFAAGGRPDDLFGEGIDITGNSLLDDEPLDDEDREEQEVKFYNFEIPWNLRLSYQINYSNNRREDEISVHTLNFSGDVELGKRWSIRASSGYDIKNPGFTYTSLGFARDLESWKLDFNWVPFSARSSWYFFIGIKKSILSDIKYDKRRAPDERL